MQFFEKRSYTAEFRAVVINQILTHILSSLKFTEGTVRYTLEETITVVDVAGDKCTNECFCMFTAEKFYDVKGVAEIVHTWVFMNKFWSNHAPRSHTMSAGLIKDSPTVMVVLQVIFCSCRGIPTSNISVLLK